MRNGWTVLAVVTALAGAGARGEPAGGAAGAGVPEENLLEEPEPTPASHGSPEKDANSFGTALRDLLGVNVSWSGYGDALLNVKLGEAAGGATPGEEPVSDFEASFNPILTAQMGESFSAETELEFSTDEGLGVEYFVVDFTLSRAAVLRAGKFIAPIGRFNEVLHPSFRWDMITRPLMFQEVIPTTWAPVGLQLRGVVDLAPRVSAEYAVYVCNGLSGEADYLAADAVLDEMHDLNQDLNSDKAFGGRVGVSLLKGERVGALELGVSVYSGAVDPEARDRLSMLDLDLALSLGPVRIRGEVAQSLLGAQPDAMFSPFEQGAYLELSYSLGSATVSGRWDFAATRPQGGPVISQRQAAVAVKLAPATFYSVRAEVRMPLVGLSQAHWPDVTLSSAYAF